MWNIQLIESIYMKIRNIEKYHLTRLHETMLRKLDYFLSKLENK